VALHERKTRDDEDANSEEEEEEEEREEWPVHFLEIGSGLGLVPLLVRLLLVKKGTVTGLDSKDSAIMLSQAATAAVYNALVRGVQQLRWYNANDPPCSSDLTKVNALVDANCSFFDRIAHILDAPALLDLKDCLTVLEGFQAPFHALSETEGTREPAGTRAAREILECTLNVLLNDPNQEAEVLSDRMVRFERALFQTHEVDARAAVLDAIRQLRLQAAASQMMQPLGEGQVPQQEVPSEEELLSMRPLRASDPNLVPPPNPIHARATHVLYDANLASLEEKVRALHALLLTGSYPNLRSLCTTVPPHEMHALGLLGASAPSRKGLSYLGRTLKPIEQRWNYFTGTLVNNLEMTMLEASSDSAAQSVYYHFYADASLLPGSKTDPSPLTLALAYPLPSGKVPKVTMYSYPEHLPRANLRSPDKGG